MFVDSVKKTVKNRHGAFIVASRLWYDLSDYLAKFRNRLFNRLRLWLKAYLNIYVFCL